MYLLCRPEEEIRELGLAMGHNSYSCGDDNGCGGFMTSNATKLREISLKTVFQDYLFH